MGGHTFHQSASAQSAQLSLSDGVFRYNILICPSQTVNFFRMIICYFRLKVDLHEFGPEDIDISVEGDQLTVLARREIKRKNESSSVREFQEKFRIPEGVDVTRLSSEISGDGDLIITGPQSGDIVTDESLRGDTDTKSSSEAKKTTTESNFVTDGGVGTTRKNEASNKTRKESVTKRVTEDGWEEEIYEEYEEEEVKTKSTTLVTAADSEEREKIAGGVTSKQTAECVSSDQSSKSRDGKILELDNSSDRRVQTREVIIPIQAG